MEQTTKTRPMRPEDWLKRADNCSVNIPPCRRKADHQPFKPMTCYVKDNEQQLFEAVVAEPSTNEE